MKINVIFAHPLQDSYQAAIHDRLVETLRKRGDEVRDFDLYRMGFNPVMSPDERRNYYDPAAVAKDIEVYVDAIRWADACLFCFPTWWSGMPAILKGYFDRVWRPSVAFEVPGDGGLIRPLLKNITHMGIITTCGSPWWYMRVYMQNPVRKVLLRGLKPMCGNSVKSMYLAQYGVDGTSANKRSRFLNDVERRIPAFLR